MLVKGWHIPEAGGLVTSNCGSFGIVAHDVHANNPLVRARRRRAILIFTASEMMNSRGPAIVPGRCIIMNVREVLGGMMVSINWLLSTQT